MRLWRANAAFWLFWLGLVVWCYFNAFDDPSSFFYDAGRAYRLRFSAVRKFEVDAFLNRTTATAPKNRAEPPLLCIGIPSINRTTESFLAHTVGSLLDTLTPDERVLVSTVVLLADKFPATHSAYGKEWLNRLSDEVLVYTNTSPGRDDDVSLPAQNYHAVDYQVRGSSRGQGRVENMRLDHSVLVERCRGSGASYFALVEDDVLASRDWFPRFRRAVHYVEQNTQERGRDWIYTRLFYSELLMGWNTEEWLGYAQVIFAAYAILVLIFVELRRRYRPPLSAAASPSSPRVFAPSSLHTSTCLFALFLCLWTPALIAIFFMAGRVSLHRLAPSPSAGVRQMANYGCCAQGLVFPQRHLEGVQNLWREPPFEFAGDMILEDYARDHQLQKWALDPSVLQHAGRRESSEGPRKADVWNFSFERQQR